MIDSEQQFGFWVKLKELWYFDYASGTHINYVLLHNDAIKVKSFQNDEHLNNGWTQDL
jgi:hypothetical protein